MVSVYSHSNRESHRVMVTMEVTLQSTMYRSLSDHHFIRNVHYILSLIARTYCICSPIVTVEVTVGQYEL